MSAAYIPASATSGGHRTNPIQATKDHVMVKKLSKIAAKKAASPAGLLDSQLAASVKDSAQQIWLAGMGAFAKAQAEGGKVFDALVKEGVSLQRKTQAVAEEKLGDVTGKMSSMASEVSSKAGASWDKLENIFEERTAKALGKLGVPTAKDVAELTRRVEELSNAVAKLSKSPKSSPPTAKAAPAKAPAKKAPARTAARKAPAKKAAATNGAAKPAAKRATGRKNAAATDTASAA
jgi:poly(hydroxyalkanoate) granule-associated protein